MHRIPTIFSIQDFLIVYFLFAVIKRVLVFLKWHNTILELKIANNKNIEVNLEKLEDSSIPKESATIEDIFIINVPEVTNFVTKQNLPMPVENKIAL